VTPQQPNPHHQSFLPLPHQQPAPCDFIQPPKEKTPHPVFFPYTVPIPWPTPLNGNTSAPIPKATEPKIPTFPESPNEDTYPLYIPVPRFEYVPVYYNALQTVQPRHLKRKAIPKNKQPTPTEQNPQQKQSTSPDNPQPTPLELTPQEVQSISPENPQPTTLELTPQEVQSTPSEKLQPSRSELTPQEIQCTPPETPTIPVNSTPCPPRVPTIADQTPSPIKHTSTVDELVTHPDYSFPRQSVRATKVSSLKPDSQLVEGYPLPGHLVKHPHPILSPFAHPVRVWAHPHESLDDYYTPHYPLHHVAYPNIHHIQYPPIHPTPYPPIHPTREYTLHRDNGYDLVPEPHRAMYPEYIRAHYPEHYHTHPYVHGAYPHTPFMDHPYLLVPERVPEPYFGRTFNLSVPRGASTATPIPVRAQKITPDPEVDKPVQTAPVATPSEEPSQLPSSKQSSTPEQSSSPAEDPVTIGGRSSVGLPEKSPEDNNEEDEAFMFYDPEDRTITERNGGESQATIKYDESSLPRQDNPIAAPGQEVTDTTPQEI